MTKFCVVLVTCRSLPEAKKIGQALVKQKLAACVSIIPQVNSLFFWQGKLSRQKEVLLIIKTRVRLFSKLATNIRKLHSYRVPEVIALPMLAGEKHYLSWLEREATRTK